MKLSERQQKALNEIRAGYSMTHAQDQRTMKALLKRGLVEVKSQERAYVVYKIVEV